MESGSSKYILRVRLPRTLINQLDAHAEEQEMSRGEVIRRLLERAVSGEAATQRALENSMRFAHIGIDAILRDLCPDGVREEVHQRHATLKSAANSAGLRGVRP